MNGTIPNEKYMRPEEACKLLKITTNTLINWDTKGKIKCARTKGGHRRFLLSDVLSMLPKQEERNKRRICYCRVSSHGQKEDLERQIEYFRSIYPTYEIIKDIGSGINFKRKGLNSILDSAIRDDIEEVVVTHKDRLCRFGFELIERIISEHSNGKIVVLNQKQTSPQEELIDDLVSIITVFSSRLYGLRSHNIKNKIKALKNSQDETVSNTRGEDRIGDDDESISLVL